MNTKVRDFFYHNYRVGRVCLIGSNDPVYELIREGQSGLTPDGKASKWNHAFLMGSRREEVIYICESDIHINLKRFRLISGPQESRIEKWCEDSIEHACVLGMHLSQAQEDGLLAKALELCYDEEYSYPLAGLVGTLIAIATNTVNKKNLFNDKHAIQCSTLVRMCYQSINADPLKGMMDDLSNTSPERIYQSTQFSFREELP